MDTPNDPRARQVDLIVIGSGAAGLTAAITAHDAGLSVIVLEKEPYFGGTTAFSGGVLWIPGSHHAQEPDTREAMHRYLQEEAGNNYQADMAEAYFTHGPSMVAYLERETEVRFVPTEYPDYHPDRPGGALRGRSIVAKAYDGRKLGDAFRRLRPPLRTITFMGMMFNSSNADLKHFFNVTRSFASAAYVARRLGVHMWHLLRHRRGVQLTAGNALAARLAKSVIDRGIPIVTQARVSDLIRENGRIVGVTADVEGAPTTFRARHGVLLAAGGFARDTQRIAQLYPHVQRGGAHVSPVPSGNTGDGIRLGEAVGAQFKGNLPNAAAWIPVSKVPYRNGTFGVFPHLVDRYKPGVIVVNPRGERFTNGAASYHDVGAAMQDTCAREGETFAWLVCDHRTIRKYGLGHVKPAPMPLGSPLRSGYLLRGETLEDLAKATGMPASAFAATIETYNRDARTGEDRAFGRGTSAFNRFLGDPNNTPNPCVAPVCEGPFYAVKLYMGDLGTFDGLAIDTKAHVLDANGQPIAGLYAAGNDAVSMMGGAYPGAGITIGPAMTFGYIAAKTVAHEAIPQPEMEVLA